MSERNTIRGVLFYRDARFPSETADLDPTNVAQPYKFKSPHHDKMQEGTIDELFRNTEDDEDDEDYDEDFDDEDDDELTDIFKLGANESEEDITDMITQNEDGSMSYTNPETGEVDLIQSFDDEIDLPSNGYKKIDDSNFNYSIKEAMTEDDEANEDSLRQRALDNDKLPSSMPRYRYVRVNVGDQVEVFVKSHSPIDRRLFLTMDPTFKDLPKKKRRQVDTVNKRTQRLIQRLGGIRTIRSLQGKECDGVVQATSRMGDCRLYVQPMSDDNTDLPVGVATCPDHHLLTMLQQGDAVRVRLEGLDEQRGQLAMSVLERIDRPLRMAHP